MYWDQVLSCLWGVIGGAALMGTVGIVWGGWLTTCS
jgi:hypothetical protein